MSRARSSPGCSAHSGARHASAGPAYRSGSCHPTVEIGHRMKLLERVVVPHRFALIYRGGQTLGYNPNLNCWEHLDEDAAEVLRWLRAGRDRQGLAQHLRRRFDGIAADRLEEILRWSVLRHLLYLDAE